MTTPKDNPTWKERFQERFGKLFFKLDQLYGTPEQRLEKMIPDFISSEFSTLLAECEGRKKINNRQKDCGGCIDAGDLCLIHGLSRGEETKEIYNAALSDICELIKKRV